MAVGKFVKVQTIYANEKGRIIIVAYRAITGFNSTYYCELPLAENLDGVVGDQIFGCMNFI